MTLEAVGNFIPLSFLFAIHRLICYLCGFLLLCLLHIIRVCELFFFLIFYSICIRYGMASDALSIVHHHLAFIVLRDTGNTVKMGCIILNFP